MSNHIILSVILIFSFSVLSAQDNLSVIISMFETYQKEFQSVPNLDPMDRSLRLKDFTIVDAREELERAISFIPDSISKKEFERNRSSYRKSKVLVYCTIGYRSGKMAFELKKAGVEAYNLKGGILLWVHSGRGLVNKLGATKSVHVYGAKWNLLPPEWKSTW